MRTNIEVKAKFSAGQDWLVFYVTILSECNFFPPTTYYICSLLNDFSAILILDILILPEKSRLNYKLY